MYEVTSQPFAKHQVEALQWLSKRDRGALLLPMGTGKTYIMLASQSIRYGTTLVICPVSVMWGWKHEIEKHTTASCRIAHGTPEERQEALESNVDFVIINYDFFSRDCNHGRYDFDRFQCVILDESTRVKNINAKRTERILAMFKETKRKYILTGSPLTRDYTDVFSQWQFIDDGRCFGMNYFRFLQTYFSPISFGGNKRSWEIREESPRKIAKRISGWYFYRAKEDCVDLPPKVKEVREFQLHPMQRKVYDDMVKDWLTEVGNSEVVVNNALTRDLTLRAVCSGFVPDFNAGVASELPSDKYQVIEEILDEIGKAQVVLWYNFNYEGAKVQSILQRRGVDFGVIKGGISASDRNKSLTAFKDRRLQGMVLQVQSGAFGINELLACTNVIYVSNSYNYELRAQSEDRTHRIGSTASCTYVDIVGHQTIESAILEVLERKAEMTPKVFRQEVAHIVQGWAA